MLAGLDISDPLHPVLVSWKSSGVADKSDNETHSDNTEQTGQEPDEVSSVDAPLESDIAPVQHHSTKLTSALDGIPVVGPPSTAGCGQAPYSAGSHGGLGG